MSYRGVLGNTVYPSIRYTGRLVTEALGTMQTENIIQTGGGRRPAPCTAGATTAT